MRKPIISIILPVYNGEDFVCEAVNSCVAQSVEGGWELIIVDDGSTDRSQQILHKYRKDPRIRYLRQDNAGPAAARNYGIRNSSGDYVAFLDADDLYTRQTVRIFINTVRELGDSFGLFYCNYFRFETSTSNATPVHVKSPMPKPLVYHQLLLPKSLPILTSTTLVKRDALDKVGLFDEGYKRCSDLELWTRLAELYQFAKIDCYSTFRRVHKKQVTKDRTTVLFWREMCNIDFLNRNSFAIFSESMAKTDQAVLAEQFGELMLKSNEPLPFTARRCFSIANELKPCPRLKMKMDSVSRLSKSWAYQIPDSVIVKGDEVR